MVLEAPSEDKSLAEQRAARHFGLVAVAHDDPNFGEQEPVVFTRVVREFSRGNESLLQVETLCVVLSETRPTKL